MLFRITLAFAIALSANTAAFACFTYGPPHYCGEFVPPAPSPSKSATDAYRDGNYALAATIAEADGSPAALAFAARARNADAVTHSKGLCLECLVKAEATARAAIIAATAQPGTMSLALHPSLAQGYIQLAVAIGLRGRLLTATQAQAEGLAEKGRAAIDRALELDPQNIWARASLGGWHSEIVRRGGPVLASVMYGASEHEGLKNFRSALSQDPANLLLSYHFALSILALDPERFRTEALGALSAGEADTTVDAMTAFTRKRAGKLIELLKAGTTDDIEALVRKFQGHPPEG